MSRKDAPRPGHQCQYPNCEERAVDPTEPARLCKHHISGLTRSKRGEEPDSDDETPRFTEGETALSPEESRTIFADRLEAADLDTCRFIDVHDGEKRSTDHTQHEPDSPSLRGNYGVYGGSGAGEDTGWILVDIDVDNYDGERAPDWIPQTFTVASPHTDGNSGGHFYVALPSGAVDALKDAFGTANPNPPWGEIRVRNQYCVGPGSQLDGCSKDWCDECTHENGGYYRIRYNEPIARMQTQEFVEALQANMPEREHERERSYPDAFDDVELDDYDPKVTASDETTEDIRDVFAALERIDARHVAADTIVHAWNPKATTSGSYRAFAPTWGPSANGTANIVDDRIWQDTGGGGYGGPVTMALIDSGDLRPDTASPRVSGELWWKGVERLRELGYDIPEYTPKDAEPYAILPDSGDLEHASSGWDWRHAGKVREGLSIDEARQRTQDAISGAYESSDRILIEALPTMGKTTGAIRAAADTGTQITYLCPRREVMEEVAQKARDVGLDVYTLPAFTRHCDTANGEHGDKWAKTVRDWYDRGATPRDIHMNAEYELGRPLPCQKHKGQECPYTSMWRFEPEDYDVLIGHYVHGHKPKVTQGRTVVFDEFPGDAYETELGYMLEASVTAFLQAHDSLPFGDYADLMENRTDAQRRSDALLWFEENEPEDDSPLVFDSSYAHAKAPYAVFTLLAAATENLGNGWERCKLPGGGYGLFDRENNVVRLLTPPILTYTSGVLALDGTPTKRMWELTLGTRLNHRQVLTDGERVEYIRDVLNLNLVRTSEYVKPYNNSDNVHLVEDRALLEAIGDKHGRKPVLITTLAAEKVYENEGVLDEVGDYEHYGNLKSSNEFATERLGVVIGSQHYGDGFIEKWGAYDGRCLERGEGKGVDLSYGAFGDRILSHMREHETLQAAMRFGRDGNGATVYVNTAALPKWVPIAGEGRVLKVWSDGMHQVLDAANGLDSWRTVDIVEHPDVDIGERQVRNHLNTLAERGYLHRETEGRGYTWRDDGLHRINEHGHVEIDAVKDNEVIAEVTRMSSYTWEFRKPTGNDASDVVDPLGSRGHSIIYRADGLVGDQPPPS